MEELIRVLLERGFSENQLLKDEPMSRHTTMRVGGPADLTVMPECREQVVLAVNTAAAFDIPAFIVGAGSNLIVRDGGIRGLVILLSDRYDKVSVEGDKIIAQAGARLSVVGNAALKTQLTGFEFACGIPGTVGGAAAMNAGAYGGELKDCIEWADVLHNGKILRLSCEELHFGYRSSRILKEHMIVLEVCFALQKGDPEAILSKMNDLAARRREKQPLSFPSSGSTFKRPEGYFAGALIEQAGLKGARVGGAQVSEKHAGFVINAGGATAQDVLALISHIQETVLSRSGVRLECEVRIVGDS